MDNQITVRDLLESYDEIAIDNEFIDGFFLISLFGKQFLFIAPFQEKPESSAIVYLYNDIGLDIPHIMLREKTFDNIKYLPDGKYRWVCLYEQDSIVNSIISYNDKVIDAIDRLIELLSMNEIEKEREFQKEFMFYWNVNAIGEREFTIYLKSKDAFAEMDAYYGEKNVRIIDRKTHLSDIELKENGHLKWINHVENDVFFIPIVDNRGIVPPHRGYSWTAQDVKNIVYAQQIEHINADTFQKVRNTIPKTQDIILVFGMQTELSHVVFSALIKCNNIEGHTLLEKILGDIVSVEPLYTNRKDFLYLNEQIGNDICLLEKKVTLVGAGSLGSYVAFELVKNGARNLKIYDEDNLEDENVLRWAYGGIGKGSNKANTISFLLNMLHPEVEVKGISTKIDEKKLSEEIKRTDLIIFTIGSSDQQLKFNRFLRDARCSVPVVFVWLEAGGIHSHILVVNYQDRGCFECLYTDENGHTVNNRSQKSPDILLDRFMIRNGCGGTRAAYGTTTLLRTTAALLDTVRDIMLNKITKSMLIDISPETVKISDIKFPEEACTCCGNRER